jgi:hypothetical protein
MEQMNKTGTPAQIVIERFGGVCELGRVLNVDKSTVSRWQVGAEKKGTSGRIPQWHWDKLLSEAKKRKIKLSIRELAGL